MKKYAIILAAGQGTRMNTNIPKCAIDFYGKTIIERIYDACKENNFDESTNILRHALSTNPYNGNAHYLLSQIYKHLGDYDSYKNSLKEALNNSKMLSEDISMLQAELKSLEP